MKSANVGPEIVAMAYELADSAARSDIECHTYLNWQHWHDTEVLKYLDDRKVVDFAVRYLDARGLIERRPDNPMLIRFKSFR
jgi:hypothetical protein